MSCSCVGIGGLEASLKLNYVLVMPVEHAVLLHNELLRSGVKERQIYEVDPNRKPRINRLANCGPTVPVANGGHKRGRAKRFMPGSIKLGTYAAAGRKYNVTMRSGTVWILMVDRAPAVDGGATMEVSPVDGGRVTKAAADGSRAEEDSRTVNAVATTGRGGDFDDDSNDDDDLILGNDGPRCKCSNKWCDDCKRSLLREYLSDIHPDEVTDQAGQHACVYKQIVDRIFVVTVTEDGCGDGGGCGGVDDDDDDDNRMTNCESTTADDVAEPSSERGPKVVARPTTTTPAQAPPVLEVEPSATPSVPVSPGSVRIDTATTNADHKPKSNTFFGKLFCKNNNKKTKKPVEPLKTE